MSGNIVYTCVFIDESKDKYVPSLQEPNRQNPIMNTYDEVDKAKESELVPINSQITNEAFTTDTVCYSTVDITTTEDAAVCDSVSALPQQQKIILKMKSSPLPPYEGAGFGKYGLSKKEKHCTSHACLIPCLIILTVTAVAAVVALIIAFMLIDNVRSDLVSIMDTMNNSESTSPLLNSQSLGTNITDLDIKFQIFLKDMEQRFGILQNNASMRNSTLEEQANNLTTIQGRVVQIQTEVERMVSELGSNLNVRLVDYDLNITNSLNALMEDPSGNISSARVIAQQSVDDFTSRFVREIQQLIEFESCDAINMISLPFSSGEYIIKTSNGSIRMYCTIFSCNGITGGWRRVAYLNSSDPSANQCPDDLEQIGTLGQINDPVSCRRNTSEHGCSSVFYANDGNSYSRVCGMINAYQVGSPDGFRDKFNDSIDSTYVDGVSLTYGMDPRSHIWTFVSTANSSGSCMECDDSMHDFIGPHYSCESNIQCSSNEVCPIDVLWNGDQCIGGAMFDRNLDQSTTDDIEVRLCRSQDRPDEDFRISLVELYVQ